MQKSLSSTSFRDPSGFLFYEKNCLYRQVNTFYKENYDTLFRTKKTEKSTLYNMLVKNEYLIPHEEVHRSLARTEDAYKIIKPLFIDFISYPYEWCFSQLKDAALLTLAIQKKALEYDMTLKDASAYNIQFVNGKPIFIDTLSFEKYIKGTPWIAYKQFCKHFLAPLFLMAFTDLRLNKLLVSFIDGIPLDLTSRILPLKTFFKFSALSHVHIHSKFQGYYSDKTRSYKKKQANLTKISLMALVENLEASIKKIKYKIKKSEWGDYYNNTNYTPTSQKDKEHIVKIFIEKIMPANVWDLGSNNGLYSRLISTYNIKTVAFDIDSNAVESNYLNIKKEKENKILPLVLDLNNPSPSLGWNNEERFSFCKRGPVDLVMALAIIHHIAISNNVPLVNLAKFLANITNYLIIEFVPKSDQKVKKLLSTREDIFIHYNQIDFEYDFSKFFKIIDKKKISLSERIIYLMKNKLTKKI